MFRREIFDHFPPADHHSPAGDEEQPAGFVDRAVDVFPALLEGDVPFYSHEIAGYWNAIGPVAEFVQANLDALTGTVAIEPPARQISEGIYAGAGSDLDAVQGKAAVLIEIG